MPIRSVQDKVHRQIYTPSAEAAGFGLRGVLRGEAAVTGVQSLAVLSIETGLMWVSLSCCSAKASVPSASDPDSE